VFFGQAQVREKVYLRAMLRGSTSKFFDAVPSGGRVELSTTFLESLDLFFFLVDEVLHARVQIPRKVPLLATVNRSVANSLREGSGIASRVAVPSRPHILRVISPARIHGNNNENGQRSHPHAIHRRSPER